MHGRRPRPTSPAELIDDVIAELAVASGPFAATAVTPRPEPAGAVADEAPQESSWLERRWARGAEVEAPPPTAPAVAPRARRRIAVPRVSLPAPLQRGLGVAAIAVGIASLALLVADLRPAPTSADPSAATRITVLPRGSASTLTMADAGALADPSVVPDASAVAPIVERSETVAAGGAQTTATMTGSTAGWLATTGQRLARGRIFTATEVTSGAHVVVLGSAVAQRLFGRSDATGRSVTVAGRAFSVIGVLAAANSGASGTTALMPVTSAQGITGTAGGRTVDRILVSAPSPDSVYTAYQEVNDLLLQTHHTANPFSTDFTVTAAATSGGHGAALIGGLCLLAVVAPLPGAMAILRLRRTA